MMFRLVLLSACVAFCGACSCIPYYFPDVLCRPSILFRGEAIAEGREGERPNQLPNSRFRPFHYPTEVFTVRVDQAFRMPANLTNNQTITIKTATGTSCDTGFSLNEDTLFAAYSQRGDVLSDYCSINTRWNDLSARSQQLLESNSLPQYCAIPDQNERNRFLVPEVRPVLANLDQNEGRNRFWASWPWIRPLLAKLTPLEPREVVPF